MASLPKDLRKVLEKAISGTKTRRGARRVAEEGATQALKSLAVHNHEPWSTDPGQQSLRNRLRAHGRQAGDVRDAQKKTQTIGHLAAECAYEQWHRMLFARFLAENNLLIDPETKARLDLDLCRDVAQERGVDWVELASSFAVRMLPQIFRAGDPVLEVTLPPETRQELEEILEALPREIFLADDSLGWVYQFWQAERKDAINKSEVKIGADELSPVTQLFTEDYMVLFLLHNTLGAWWAGKVLVANPELASSATDEPKLREACAVGEIEWTNLRFIREDAGPWRPAAGTFDGWPEAARDITLLDPCMGSGHFLVFALPILAAMRAKEESLSKKDAMLAVLRDNLHGLELDRRCTQIAAFNLALATWKSIGYQPEMPRLRLACSGLPIAANQKEWTDLAGADSPWAGTMAQMHALFKQAPVLGSLIDPMRVFGDLFESTFGKIRPALRNALAEEHATVDEDELAISAEGLLDAAELLMSRFTLIATNVPYLGRAKQSDTLKTYCHEHYKDAEWNLAVVFLARCHRFLTTTGTVAVVAPQLWRFGDKYDSFRKKYIAQTEFVLFAPLGSGAFETISGQVVDVVLCITSNGLPTSERYSYCVDGADGRTPGGKARLLLSGPVAAFSQLRQLTNPDSRLTFSEPSSTPVLSRVAKATEGLSTGDAPRFVRFFWELPIVSDQWAFLQSAPLAGDVYSGMSYVLRWEGGNGEVSRSSAARIRGQSAWGKRGIVVAKMSGLRAGIYFGGLFSKNCAVIASDDDAVCRALLAFAGSDECAEAIHRIGPGVNTATTVFEKIPFDKNKWIQLSKDSEAPPPASRNPAEALYDGCLETSSHPLQVAVASLVGFVWPRFSKAKVPGLGDDRGTHAEDGSISNGVFPLYSLGGEPSAADQLRARISTERGHQFISAELAVSSLDRWLRDEFFAEHCEVFGLPFIWHIWDGLEDGFHVLVNYHKLAAPDGEGHRTLEKLIHTTLARDWMERQRHAASSGIEGAQEKLVAAEHLRRELTKILDGESPYDIFVRWKPLYEQPIGWNPDVNDGVRMNIRPFMTAKAFNGKSIFRASPQGLAWRKDDGKESAQAREDYPWFWNWDGYTENFSGVGPEPDGNRWNDLHYTRAFKEAARQRARGKAS